jgi:AcrR family transcriptional regulator
MSKSPDGSDLKWRQTIEKSKDKRRNAILAACERLIRETGSTDFSMKDLAGAAGISTYTTYNLIGSKSTVLYALLNQGIDQIYAADILQSCPADPIDQVFRAGDAVSAVFTDDPDYYRPLMRYLLGALDPVNRPTYMKRAFLYWRRYTRNLEESGCLRNDFSSCGLARGLQVLFTGAIDYWVHDEISGDELRAQVRHGIAVHLLAATNGGQGGLLGTIIAETEPVVIAVMARIDAAD